MSALDEAATVGGLLLRSARRWPDSPALVEGQTVLTHRQAASRARTVARRLAARGVRCGDRVALALPNGWRYAVTYLGVQLAGGTAVLVNTRFAPPEIEYVLGDSDACAAVVDAETSARVPRLCPQWDVDELTGPGAEADELPGLAAASTDIANILYTSGTTGRPKGAMQTHGNLVFNAGTVRSVLRVTAQDRTLVVAPMFHATGIASQLVGFGAQGAACVFQPRFRPADMLGALIEHRITFFAGVTAMIQLMLADPAFDPAGLPALRAACFGGAPVGVLARHPAIAEVAVVGVPDPVMGERVCAVAVPGTGQSLALGTLREWAGTQLADYKLPTELVILSALPRNASGKVIKKQLAAQLAEQLAGTRSPSAPART